MTDILRELPRLSWRGIEVPVTARSDSFAHETVEHSFLYRDNQIIERTGARNVSFSYTIPFRQDINKAPYERLFTEVFTAFYFACRDRTPDTLIDPILGEFRAVCTSWDGETDPNKRDGTDVRVTFLHSPLIDDVELEMITGGVATVAGVQSETKRLDNDVRVINWQQEEPPQPTTDPLSAIAGLGRQTEGIGNRISARLEDTAERVRQVEETADRLEDPKQTANIIRSARKVRAAALRAKSRVQDPARRIVRVTTRFQKTLTQAAADSGMTLQELLRLNPTLARMPLIPVGYTVNVFERTSGSV